MNEQTITGTITLANGTTVQARKHADGTITWDQYKMVRRSGGVSIQGVSKRTATAKQAATFTLDVHGIATMMAAEDAAYAEIKPVAKPVMPKVDDNFRHMANFADSASARRFWARKAGLVDALLAAL